MPKGPKGEKRPADVIGNAVKSMPILIGEELTPRVLVEFSASAIDARTLRRSKASDVGPIRDIESTDFPREVAEAALAHIVSNQVEAAYRRGDLFDKRRHLMDTWGEYCVPTPSKARTV